MSASQRRGATPQPSPLAPGTTFSDFCDARGRFFETLRRDADLHCLEAALSSATGPAMLNRKVDQPVR